MPRVSVIISTYNTASYVAEAVESVLAQTYKDYEIIVVDDGSTDNTREVLMPYMDRIRYVWQKNQERSAARNHGIRLAQGELIAFLDADDVWLPDKLERQVAALDGHDQAVLVCGPAQNIDAEGRPISFWGSAYLGGEPGGEVEVRHHGQEMLFGSPILPCTVVVRREALDRAGPFDTRLSLGEDWEMWLRLARLGPFVHLPWVLSQYRAYASERELRKRASNYMVAQYIYVINKTAATDPARFPALLRDQALASVYAHSALASYELGDVARGQEMLAQAVNLDRTLAERTRLTFLLEDHARRILRDTGDEARVLAFLNMVVANLPPGVESPWRGARGILSRVYMADAFRAHGVGDKKTIQQVLWPGLRNDPAWLLNWGVLSIAVRSLLMRRCPHRAREKRCPKLV